MGTWDPTNSFKAYNRDFVREVGIDSDKGFEVGIELVAKARRLRLPVAEVPDYLARPHLWGIAFQDGQVAARLPALVPVCFRAEAHGGGAAQNDRHERRTTNMTTVLVSGSAGFIGGYVVEELLRRGYEVIGVDNFSKYGPVKKSYDADPHYTFCRGRLPRRCAARGAPIALPTISSPARP